MRGVAQGEIKPRGGGFKGEDTMVFSCVYPVIFHWGDIAKRMSKVGVWKKMI